MNVLIIAPHPDDECIGCGGSVCRHVEEGDEVHIVFLTSGELGLKNKSREEAWTIREQEARAAAKILKVASTDFLRYPDWTLADELPRVSEKLSFVLHGLKPTLIYLPHPNEWHPDHKASLPALCAALADSGIRPPALRGYEVWTPMAEYQHVENITDVMTTKLRALRRHQSQTTSWNYIRATRALNEFRGEMAGRCRYAEVFQDLSAVT
jgi:LmbE family N-acetylglucosaminyl deacetylase